MAGAAPLQSRERTPNEQISDGAMNASLPNAGTRGRDMGRDRENVGPRLFAAGRTNRTPTVARPARSSSARASSTEFYTGYSICAEFPQTICDAVSDDGVSWTTHAANRCLVRKTDLYQGIDWRDRFAFYNDQDGCFWLNFSARKNPRRMIGPDESPPSFRVLRLRRRSSAKSAPPTFADQAAIAIENARLFEEAQAHTLEPSQSLDNRPRPSTG